MRKPRRPGLGSIRSGSAGRRCAAALALVVALAVAVALAAGAGSPSPSHAASKPRTVSGATTVQRRDLVQTDTESGTLSYAHSQTVYNRVSGTLTWLPAVGELIEPGQTMYRVDDAPVILLDGSTPAYRTLKPGVGAGPDALELNQNLVNLGFNPDGITVDDSWQAATTAGVDAWQASLGESQTGTIPLGKVVFLPGEQRVTTVTGTLGATVATTVSNTTEFVTLVRPRPGSGGGDQAGAKRHAAAPSAATAGNAQTLAALTALLKAEIAQLKAASSRASSPSASAASKGTSSAAASGNRGASSTGAGTGRASAGTPVLTTTSTQLVVTVDLDATLQSEAVVGEHVTVEMPSGNTVGGKVTAVSPVAVNSGSSGSGAGSGSGSGAGSGGSGGSGGNGGSSGSGATIPVTITLSGHQSGAGLDQAAVSVNFAQAKANNVLSVPVTALLATAGGSYAVQEATAPHKLISVQTGLFAAGYVQISGAGIAPGLQVTDSQG